MQEKSKMTNPAAEQVSPLGWLMGMTDQELDSRLAIDLPELVDQLMLLHAPGKETYYSDTPASRTHIAELYNDRYLPVLKINRGAVYRITDRPPSDQRSLDAIADRKKTGIELEKLARMGVPDLMRDEVVYEGSGYPTGFLRPFYSGLVAVAVLCTDPLREKFSYMRPEVLILSNSSTQRVLSSEDSKIAATRTALREGGAAEPVIDVISGFENYLAALDDSVARDVVTANPVLSLGQFFSIAPDFAMCYLGAAKGLRLASQRFEGSEREGMLALAKQAYINSGLSGTPYAGAELFRLGDPRMLSQTRIPEPMWGSFMEWLSLQQPKPE